MKWKSRSSFILFYQIFIDALKDNVEEANKVLPLLLANSFPCILYVPYKLALIPTTFIPYAHTLGSDDCLALTFVSLKSFKLELYEIQICFIILISSYGFLVQHIF